MISVQYLLPREYRVKNVNVQMITMIMEQTINVNHVELVPVEIAHLMDASLVLQKLLAIFVKLVLTPQD